MGHDFRRPVEVPIFDGQLQSHMDSYIVCALAIHLGSSIQQGHYRALLVDHVSGYLHYCDDDKRSKVLRNFASVAPDVYVVFLVRREIMQCAAPVN